MPATVHASISKVRTVSSSRESVAVPLSRPEQAFSLTSGASSVASTEVVENLNGDGGNTQVWTVTVAGSNVWVMFGENPTAVAGEGFLIIDGTTRDFGCVAGDKIAVIDA